MSPFEALYGRKSRTPLYWSETGERQLFGADIIREAEKQVQIIGENLRIAQSRQKSYADGKRRDVVFQEGDYVYLKVSPIGPFKILERVGEVAYRLELPDQLADVHDVFHISQLKKGFGPHDKEPLPLEDLNIKEDLTIVEHPIRILETMTRVTRNSVINMCKVQWSNHAEDEATWEREDELKAEFPDLFLNLSESLEDEILLKGGRICNTLILLKFGFIKICYKPLFA
jgi:hypothetical protein